MTAEKWHGWRTGLSIASDVPIFAGFVTWAIQECHCVHNADFSSHSVQVALALDSERL